MEFLCNYVKKKITKRAETDECTLQVSHYAKAIDLLHKWRPIYYSSQSMLISPISLITRDALRADRVKFLVRNFFRRRSFFLYRSHKCVYFNY